MNNKNVYRLIKPYQSDKVYEARTTLHGAGKCYNELKKNNVNCTSFTIMNLDDNSIYDFKINDKPKMVLKENDKINELLQQNGGEKSNDLDELKNIINNLKNNFNNLTNNFNNLTNRVKILEEKNK
jgi:hypothetical protein